MKTKIFRIVSPLLGLLLVSLALWVLHRELKGYHVRDVLQYLADIPSSRLLPALLLTALSYLTMTGYDALAVLYIQHPLPYRKIAFGSFLGYAFGNSMGLGMITSGSIRYRLYTVWGFSGFEITRIVAFCGLTFWLGFLTLGGILFFAEPVLIPRTVHLPFASAHALGGISLGLVGAYLLLILLRKKPFKVWGWEFSLPPTYLVLPQIAIAALDWMLAGSVLYMLLPNSANTPLPRFLAVYLLAQVVGLASQVPGGLGVFETIIILLLPPVQTGPALLGSLLIYRVMYYLLPLLVAAILLGTQELMRRKVQVEWMRQVLKSRISPVVPPFLAFTTFVGGAILLFSGATPPASWRLSWLQTFLPLPVLEISHFLGSLAGMGLLLLARGLQRRLDAAYILTTILLGGGILFALLKGLHYEEAIVLSAMLMALLPCRRYFYRKASLTNQVLTPAWIAAIALVFLCFIWLGLFSYKHVEYSSDLWWQFAFSGSAPRFLRATVGALGMVLFFAVARLLRPASPRAEFAKQEEVEKAVSIVRHSRLTYANLALLGDKSFLFSQNATAFIMYRVEGRSWVAMGDPVGAIEEWGELVWEFRETCDRFDGWTVFYEIRPENVPLYIDLGLSLLKLGEEARVPLNAFSLEGGAHKGLRHTTRRLEKEGCAFEVIQAEDVPSILPELKQVSDTWLREKKTREKGFSLGFFKEDYLKAFPAGIVRRDGRIIAFANIWTGAEREELSLDLMRYLPEAPHGVMEHLFIQMMLWGRHQGYRWFNLGMAPLSGLEARTLAPLWNRLGAFVFVHGEHFYNFQGLRQYKEKFNPEWEPRYLASPGGLVLPRIFANLTSLISGGLTGVIAR